MPHQNEQLLRAGYDGFTKHGDLEPMLGALTDDITWQHSALGPLAGTYTGKDEVLGVFRQMMEVYGGTLRLEVVDILVNDDRGVVLTREQGTVGGEAISWTGVHLWSFRGGRATSFVLYADANYQQFWSKRT